MKGIYLFIFLCATSVFSQVGINTEDPNASTALDINSQLTTNHGGLKFPTVTEAERGLINTTTTSDGILVYVIYPSGNRCLEIYDAISNNWQQINCANNATQLIISEYVEADADNKFIELYNPTASAINLADYKLIILRNGGTFPVDGTDREFFLSGTLAAGDTYVIANDGQTLLAVSQIDLLVPNSGNPLDFGGNDPVLLTDTSNNIIDIIGIPGTDPGSGYAVDGTITENATIRRNLGISVPNSTWTPFEWTAFPNNDVSGLGAR